MTRVKRLTFVLGLISHPLAALAGASLALPRNQREARLVLDVNDQAETGTCMPHERSTSRCSSRCALRETPIGVAERRGATGYTCTGDERDERWPLPGRPRDVTRWLTIIEETGAVRTASTQVVLDGGDPRCVHEHPSPGESSLPRLMSFAGGPLLERGTTLMCHRSGETSH